YPEPTEKNLVYLPDRAMEAQFGTFLIGLGFECTSVPGRYRIRGDKALDVISNGAKAFPEPWKVTGFDHISKGIRFAELGLRVSISSGGDAAKSGKIDWFDCHVVLQQNNANVPLSSLFRNVKGDSDKWVQLDSGAFARVPGGGVG